MEIVLKGNPNEIAALVVALQERREGQLSEDEKMAAESARAAKCAALGIPDGVKAV